MPTLEILYHGGHSSCNSSKLLLLAWAWNSDLVLDWAQNNPCHNFPVSFQRRYAMQLQWYWSVIIASCKSAWELGLYRTSLSGPEVRQISKVRTQQKPDVLLPGHRTFITWKNGKKIQKNFFLNFSFVYLFGLGTFDTKFVFRDLILWEVITCNW